MDLRRLVVFFTVLAFGFSTKEQTQYRTVNIPQEVKRVEVAPIRRHRAAEAGQVENTTNTAIIEDDHVYYTAQYYKTAPADYPWIELSHKRNAHNRSTLATVLLTSDLLAEVVETGFTFPYYGHPLSSVVVSTRGFLYMNPDYLHPWIAVTQYVAPLMANFDFGLSNDSSLYYASIDDNGVKKFVVQWDNVLLNDHPKGGNFIFQCVIFEDGTIVFAYKKIPLKISSISDENHQVAVGIADAFYYDVLSADGSIFRLIFEYHNADLTEKFLIVDNAVVVLTPVKNCVMAKTCDECDEVNQNSYFMCEWCPILSRCSDGIDRHRLEWIIAACHVDGTLLCSTLPTASSPTNSPTNSVTNSTAGSSSSKSAISPSSSSKKFYLTSSMTSTGSIPSAAATVAAKKGSGNSGFSAGARVGIALGIVLLIVIGLGVAWFVYGYTHPNSKAGRCLIEHGRFWKKTPSDNYAGSKQNEAAASEIKNSF